jgi:hypothetical protein
VALWKDRLEDDGAVHASETALRRIADAAVSDALQGLRRAFLDGDVSPQCRPQLLLELARLLRVDLQRDAGPKDEQPGFSRGTRRRKPGPRRGVA